MAFEDMFVSHESDGVQEPMMPMEVDAESEQEESLGSETAGGVTEDRVVPYL